jgi:hypothetical protein
MNVSSCFSALPPNLIGLPGLAAAKVQLFLFPASFFKKKFFFVFTRS